MTVLAAFAVVAVLAGAPAQAWERITPGEVELSPIQRVERLDRSLLKPYGSLMGAIDSLGTSSGLEEAYLTIIQHHAIEAWELVEDVDADRCWRAYWAVLHTGYALMADSIDSYRAEPERGSPEAEFRKQINAGMYLLGDYATLERNLAGERCVPATPVPTPRTTPGPAERPTADPGVDSVQPTASPEARA